MDADLNGGGRSGFRPGRTLLRSELLHGQDQRRGSLLGLAEGPAGQVTIAGQVVDFDLAADSLTDLLTAINSAGIPDVTATITSSSNEDGSSQFRLRIDGTTDFVDAGNVLESLGIVVGSNSAFESVARVLTGNVANQQEGVILIPEGSGARSSTFGSDADPLGAILGSSTSGTITVGGAQVVVDLAVDSISDLRDKINAVAPAGVSASVDVVGASDFELVISGTTDFDDPDGILEELGIIGASSALITATRFGEIAGAGVKAGDTVSVFGADHGDDQVAGTFTVSSANLTVDTLLTSVEQLFGGSVTASIDAEGRVVLTDDQAGSSSLTLNLTANNEGGGSLSFGAVTATTEGTDARSAELQAGQDAFLRINGIALTRFLKHRDGCRAGDYPRASGGRGRRAGGNRHR